MRAKSYLVLLSLTLLLMLPNLAIARPVHNFDCSQCHLSNLTIDELGGDNVCLSCHNDNPMPILLNIGTSPTPGGNFVSGDASDHYGNNPTPGDETSHNWAATSTNPAAGASEPNRALHPGFYGRYGTTDGRVACSRCHEPHAQIETNPKLLKMEADRVTPLTPNAMCLACHKDYADAMAGNQGLLSHPMVNDYATFQSNNSATYNPVAATYDPANPYANGVQLVDGNISCLTCHNLHFTDSDTSTTDGPGQALNAGDGLLLRGNGTQFLGASGEPTGGSVCTVCHNYDNVGGINAMHGTNGGTKDVGCLACHGGHNYNNDNPTWYMLNDPTGSYSTVGAPPADLNAAWVGTEGAVDGFCETCHGDITTWNAATNTGVGRDHNFAADAGQCVVCHNSHGEGSFSEAAGCNDCHGWPPADSTGGGPNATGYAIADLAFGGFPATNYNYNGTAAQNGGVTYLDESTTAHAVHALGNADEYKFSCNACHQGNTHNDPAGGANNNPTFQDVFLDTAGLVAETGGLNPGYTGTTNTCDTVYCHSDGVNAARTVAGPNAVDMTTFTWANGANASCTSCHNTGSSGTATVHATHLALPALDGAAVTCGTCHNATWASANTLKTNGDGTVISTHVDGDVDVAFNTTLIPTAPMNQVAGTCAVYCHSNGTAPLGGAPDWDDNITVGDCVHCHAVTSGAGLSAAHDTHLDEGLACSDCHTHDGSAFGGDHINGTKDVTADVCNTCHGSTTGGTGVDAYPVFTNNASVTCNTCHQGTLSVIGGNTAPDASGTATNLHSDTCTTCHTDTPDNDHIGGVTTKRLIAANSNAACNICHGNGGSVATMNGIDTHQAIDCAGCHDPHYAGLNLSMIRPVSTGNYTGTVVFRNTTGNNSYDEADAANGDDICATCHTAANQTIQHNNSANAGVAHNEGLDCFACHKPHTDDVAPFGVGAGTNCSDCHGYPPTSGAHAAHSTVADGDKDNAAEDFTDCAACHGATVTSYTYSAGGNHLNGTTNFVAGLGYDDNGTRTNKADDLDTTCAGACHSTAQGQLADWYTDTSLACDTCHGGQAADTLTIATESHGQHITASFDCDSCHNGGTVPTDLTHIGATGADEGATLTARANPVQDDALVDVPTEWIDGANSCSNIACHDPSSAGKVATWGTANAVACAFCHADASTDPATGSHTQHLAGTVPGAFKSTPVCADCHGTLPVSNTHLSGTVDVAAGITYSADRTDFTNTTYGTCSTTDCHNDGLGVAAVSPTWGRAPSAADDCTICHTEPPATGSHNSHPASIASCTTCHNPVTPGSSAPTQHLDDTVDVANAADTLGYPANRALGSGTWTTCNTLVCHNDGQGTADGTTGASAVVTPTWGDNAATCGQCHPAVPSSAKHDEHLGVYGSTCGDCHLNAGNGSGLPTSNHLNGTIDVLASLNYDKPNSAAPGDGWGNCSDPNTGCHSSGEARPWDNSAGSCNTCHGQSAATGAPLIPSDLLSSPFAVTGNGVGQHPTHVTTEGYSCNICHDGNGPHPDSADKLEVAFTGLGTGGTYDGDPALGGGYTYNSAGITTLTATQDCSNLYCHSSVQADGGVAAPSYATAVWDNASTGACGTCHSQTDPATGAHTAHVNDGTIMADKNCTDCHSAAAAHVDGNVDLNVDSTWGATATYSGTAAPRDGYGNCNNVYCHSDAQGTYKAVAWGATISDCISCHEGATAGTTLSGAHEAHVVNATATIGQTLGCVDCHAATVSGNTTISTPAQHVDGGVDVISCSTNSCHTDGNTGNITQYNPDFATDTLDCINCHGNNVDQSYPSYAEGNAGTANANSHGAHVGSSNINCEECHETTSTVGTSIDGTDETQHVDGGIDVGLKQGGTFAQGAGETCSATYCHGSGASPAWGTVGPLTCDTCHSANNALENSHGAHYELATVATSADFAAANNSTTTAYEFSCGSCHNGTSHASGAVNANQAAEVTLSGTGTYTAGGTTAATSPDRGFDYTAGTCGTNDCHNDGTGGAPNVAAPQWSVDTLDCTGCHNSNAAATGNEMASGSHTAHMDDGTIMSDKTCQTCHDATMNASDTAIADKTQHIDGGVDVALLGTFDSDANPANNFAGNACNNVYCHSDAQGTYKAVTWGATISDCISCHEGATAGTTLSGAHEAHVVNATATIGQTLGCVDCHAATVSGNTTISTPAQHVDGGVDVISCSTNSCHTDGNTGNITQYNPDFATDTLDCINCHGNNVDQSYPSYAEGNAGTANANSHGAHVGSSNINCEECHETTSTVGTSIDGTDETQHVDGGIDVGLKQGGTFAQGAGETCSATYCHGSGASPAWGTVGPLTCDTCHSANNALENSHGAHYELATVATSADFAAANNSTTTAYEFSCGSCHNGTSHASGAVNANQAAEVTLSGTGTYTAGGTTAATSPDRGFDYTAGTCGTNDCHNDGTGGAPNVAAPQWSVDTLDCTGCHNGTDASGSRITSGSHSAHVSPGSYGPATNKNCQSCHDATMNASNTAIADKTQHVDGGVDIAIIPSVDSDANPANNFAANDCNNIYCHSTGQSTSNGASATPTYVTATWGNAPSGACGSCHKVTEASGLTSGSHGAHLGTTGVNGCADCHTGAANNASDYSSVQHVDKDIDVANTYSAAGAPGNGYGVCSNASCHNDGTGAGGIVDSPTWGGSATCASCHADDMTTASHDIHLNTAMSANSISCDSCHGNAVKSVSGISGGLHFNNTLQVYNSAAGDLGYPNNVTLGGAPYSSCSTTYCHGDTLSLKASAADFTPAWGASLGSQAQNCDVCHGYPPAGSHPANSDCSACHNHVNDNDVGFAGTGGDVSKHIDGIIQIDGGDTCTDCHGGGNYIDPDTGDHSVHTDADTVLAGKGLVAGDYGTGAWWYAVTYDATGRPQMGCGQCHPATESIHLNGSIQTDLDPAGETAALAAVSPNAKENSNAGAAYSGGTCSNVYCHSDGNGSFANVTGWNAVAGDKGITCASCHGNSPTTAAHGVHEVGIHFEELYSGTTGLLDATGPVSSGAAHGDTDVSTTINCFTCHNNTVTDSANAGNSTCLGCHSDTNSIITGNELARIQSSSTVHLNGAKDVNFAVLTGFKSKAQLRSNLADADDGSNILSNIWNRLTGYKGATDHDEVKVAFSTPVFTQGADTCSTVACHNGNTATWSDSGVDCAYCHTSLPK